MTDGTEPADIPAKELPDQSVAPDQLKNPSTQPVAGESAYDRERGDDNRHEIVMPCEGRHSYVFLRLPDRSEHAWVDLPLGKLPNRKADDAEKRAREGSSATVLVPILPLVYTTAEADKDEAQPPESGDRLYIFVDGHLWRELEVTLHGYMRDINLEYTAGLDGPEREATGVSVSRLEMPYQLQYYRPEIRVAVAKTPWSWARINSLGGMRASDFRVGQQQQRIEANPEHYGAIQLLPTPEQRDGAEQRLRERTQPLDLTGYRESFRSPKASEACAEIEGTTDRANRDADAVGHIRLREISGVVYLHDPVRVAKNLAAEVLAQRHAMQTLAEEIKAHPEFDSAILARQVFFSPALHEKTVINHGSGGFYNKQFNIDVSYRDTSKTAEHLRHCAAGMDETYLRETVLRGPDRREQRDAVRRALAKLAAFLDHRLVQEKVPLEPGESITAVDPSAVDWNVGLLDYAYHQGQDYLELWRVFARVADSLNHDPFDTDIDADQRDIEDERAVTRPGRWYLDKLADRTGESTSGASHVPLAEALFPTRDQVDPTDPDANGGPDEPNRTARGGFAPARFRQAVASAEAKASDTRQEEMELVVKVPRMLVSNIALLFRGQVDGSVSDVTEGASALAALNRRMTDAIVALLKASRLDYTEDLHVAEAGAIDGDTVVLKHGPIVSGAVLDEAPEVPRNDQGWRRLHHGNPNLAATPLEEPLNYTTQAEWQGLFGRTDRDGVLTQLNRYYVATKTRSPLYRQLTSDELKEAIADKGSSVARRLAPFVAVLEAYNLKGAINELRKSGQSPKSEERLTTAVIVAAGGFAAATAETAKALIPARYLEASGNIFEAAVERSMGQAMAERVKTVREHGLPIGRRLRVRLLPAFGAAMDFAATATATWDSMDAADRGDYDLMIAYGLKAVAHYALARLTLVGAAASLGYATGTAATLLGLGIWGWVALVGVLVTTMIVQWLTHTELERWAFYGPFGKQDHGLFGTDHRYSESYAQDADNPRHAYERLVAILMEPNVILRWHGEAQRIYDDGPLLDIEVECRLPGFEPGTSALSLVVTWTHDTTMPRTQAHAYAYRLTPYKAKPVHDAATGRIIGKRFAFLDPLVYPGFDEYLRGTYNDERAIRSFSEYKAQAESTFRTYAFLKHTLPSGVTAPVPDEGGAAALVPMPDHTAGWASTSKQFEE